MKLYFIGFLFNLKVVDATLHRSWFGEQKKKSVYNKVNDKNDEPDEQENSCWKKPRKSSVESLKKLKVLNTKKGQQS